MLTLPAGSCLSSGHLGYAHVITSTRQGEVVITLGIILLIIGIIAKIAILTTVGIILLVVGAILVLMGTMGRAVGGRRHYY